MADDTDSRPSANAPSIHYVNARLFVLLVTSATLSTQFADCIRNSVRTH